MTTIYVFAECHASAIQWIRNQKRLDNTYVIVDDTSRIQGLRLTSFDQLQTVGHWYNNHQVALAYDYAVFDVKRNIEADTNARNHRR